MKTAGLNAIRIPLGYWAVDLRDEEPYIGGQYSYLIQAVQWAQEVGLQVMIDLHGAPGSQNGQDNSGLIGPVLFATNTSNTDRSLDVLRNLTEEFSQSIYGGAVTSIELLNEPRLDDEDFSMATLKDFYADGAEVVSGAQPDNINVAIHGTSSHHLASIPIHRRKSLKSAQTPSGVPPTGQATTPSPIPRPHPHPHPPSSSTLTNTTRSRPTPTSPAPPSSPASATSHTSSKTPPSSIPSSSANSASKPTPLPTPKTMVANGEPVLALRRRRGRGIACSLRRKLSRMRLARVLPAPPSRFWVGISGHGRRSGRSIRGVTGERGGMGGSRRMLGTGRRLLFRCLRMAVWIRSLGGRRRRRWARRHVMKGSVGGGLLLCSVPV